MFGPSGLSRQERELPAVVVSNANACVHGIRAHADDLRAEDAHDWAENAEHDHCSADLPPRTRALCDFAVALTHAPAANDADTYINRVADGVGIAPEPDWA